MIFGRLKSCIEVTYLARGVINYHCHCLNDSFFLVGGISEHKKQLHQFKRLERCHELN
jgi:hypothetical protein